MPTSSLHPISREELLEIYKEAVLAGIPLSKVQAKIEELEAIVEKSKQNQKKAQSSSRLTRLLPIVLITFGSILVGNAVWPIVSYTLFVSPQLRRVQLHSPIPMEEVLSSSSMASSVVDVKVEAASKDQPKRPKPIILSQNLDYTNLANWFVDAGSIEDFTSQVEQETYYIDIPSLNIEKAEIVIGGTDLNSSLIQYPGTADPGEYGAPVLFGHSVLRQFYRPDISNPNRYKSIFSKIMTLESGEEIYVTHDRVKYTYRVKDKHEVEPEDLFILEQKIHSKELKLVTCVPEGTYLRRGVVVAELVETSK